MAVTQISKICIKKGSINYLPDSLDEAEMCFTTDTGEVFIGAPNYGPVQYRAGTTEAGILPYRNIKILTEFDVAKSLTGDVMINSPLVNFNLPSGGTSSVVYTFGTGMDSIVANYSLYDENTNSVQNVGTLYIASIGGTPTVVQVGMPLNNITFSASTNSTNQLTLSCINKNSTYKMYMSASVWKNS